MNKYNKLLVSFLPFKIFIYFLCILSSLFNKSENNLFLESLINNKLIWFLIKPLFIYDARYFYIIFKDGY